MKNIIVKELKELLSIEEVDNNLSDCDYVERLLENSSKNRVAIDNNPHSVGYSCVIQDDVYDTIVSHDNCGDFIINIVKEANGILQLGEITFKDLMVKAVANYPSLSDGVDVSISFEVTYKNAIVETITPAIIPGHSKDLKEYLLHFSLLMQDQIDRCALINPKFLVPLSIEEFKKTNFYKRSTQKYLSVEYDMEVFYFNQNKKRQYISFTDIGLRLYVSTNKESGSTELRLVCGDGRSGYFKEFEKVSITSENSAQDTLTKTIEILKKVQDNLEFFKEEQFQILKNYGASYFETAK